MATMAAAAPAAAAAAAAAGSKLARGSGRAAALASPRQCGLSPASRAAALSSGLSFGVSALPQRAAVKHAARRLPPGALRVEAAAREVLIVNTNSGGHAVIGFWLARQLQTSGHSVTIMTVGEEASDKMKKPPFSKFSELRDAGVKTVWGDPSNIGDVLGSNKFDVVLDNNGKDMEAVQPVADWAKASGVEQFLFISSAGIYKGTDEPPFIEGDPVKEDSGHALVEKYLSEQFDKWGSFRPQYMTGNGNNKDCEEWFFDRIVRDRPVPVPGSGMQLTIVAHVSDLANMLTLAVEKPEAAVGIFNCVSDRAVSLDGFVKMCARAAGKEAKIVHYDPKECGVDVKKAFPFRNVHFYSEPKAAKEKLGWENKTDLQEALNQRYQAYTDSGRDKKDIKFALDDQILDKLKTPVLA